MYVSYCPALDVASCGETVDQARRNLQEVILINLEETKKWGHLTGFLRMPDCTKSMIIYYRPGRSR